jgi:hypothetical protein
MHHDNFKATVWDHPRGASRLCRVTCVFFILLGMSPGCGDRSVANVDQGSAHPADGSHYLQREKGVPLPDGSITSTNPCMIAIRVDDCCTEPIAALVSEVEKDPCLVPYPVRAIPDECQAKWPARCSAIDCSFAIPKSRLVGLTPLGCLFVSECQNDADCELVNNVRHCCTCATAYPRSMIEQDACLMPVTMSAYPPPGCNEACNLGVMCDMACPPYQPVSCKLSVPTNDKSLRLCYPHDYSN